MATRSNARSFKPAKTVAQPTQPDTRHAADVSEPDQETMFARMQASVDGYLRSIHAPSWTRRVVATLVGLFVTASTWYACASMINVLIIAVAVYTGPGFLAFLVAFISIFVALVASISAGSQAFDLVMQFDYTNVKNRVTGFFGRFRREPVAQ